MNILKPVLAVLLAAIFIAGCSTDTGSEPEPNPSDPSEKNVTANVIFRAFSAADQQPLSGVTLVIVDPDGQIVDQPVTNGEGEVHQELTVPADPRYPMARGTVTVIAYKEGYRDAVILEVPVSEGSAAQPIPMEPVAPGERNEPTVQPGNNHHLEILALVDKYKADAP
jgi:hypothetical protein